jgi:tetratricopeptide (TPR) repeat protein
MGAVDNALSFCSANTRINRIITEVAASRENEDVRLTDSGAALAAKCADGIPGSEFFYDHVHLTFEGNHAIACKMFKSIAELVGQDAEEGRTGPVPPSLEQCMRCMGYSAAVQLKETDTVLSILKNSPMNPAPPRLESLRQELAEKVGPNSEDAVAEGNRQAVALDPGNLHIRYCNLQYLAAHGSVEEVLEGARALVEEVPFNWEYRSALVNALLKGDPQGARRECKALAALYPEYESIQGFVGNALLSIGCPDEAFDSLRAALALSNGNPASRCALGRGFAMKGDFRRAEACLRRAIAEDASQTDGAIRALHDAVLPFRQAQDWKKTVEGFETALRLKPDSEELLPELAAANYEAKHFDAAWREIAECQRRSIKVPEGLMESLKRDSGRAN